MEAELDPGLHTVPPNHCPMHTQPKWRQEFPIDRAQDEYVARREFTKFLGLTSLAFVVGQIWIGAQNAWRKSRGALPIREVALLEEVPPNSVRQFNYPTAADPALLIRLNDDQLLAYNSQCTHLQCPVLPELEHNRFHCPCHAGFFDLQSGRPTAGPPRRDLRRIALKIQNGTIYATGVERTSS